MTVPFPQMSLVTHIAGASIPALAERFDTPAYIYDAAPIVRRIGQLKQFDAIRYAQKACSSLAILDLMRRHGVVVDAVSAGEIHRALAAGYQPGQKSHPAEIVYTADLFDRETLEFVIQHDLPVNCGSPDMIDQYGAALARRAGSGPAATGRSITLRINPGFGHGHSQKTNTGGSQSKHGIWHGQLADCAGRAAKHGLTIGGLHMHIGSGSDMEHLGQVCGAMEKAALEVGPSITSISAGGGLPIDYRKGEELADTGAYYRLWNASRQKLAAAFGHSVSLEIEPGRYLVAESGYLISEIRAVKEMGENTFYLVDAGFNNLARLGDAGEQVVQVGAMEGDAAPRAAFARRPARPRVGRPNHAERGGYAPCHANVAGRPDGECAKCATSQPWRATFQNRVTLGLWRIRLRHKLLRP